jgi:hypothetical protein
MGTRSTRPTGNPCSGNHGSTSRCPRAAAARQRAYLAPRAVVLPRPPKHRQVPARSSGVHTFRVPQSCTRTKCSASRCPPAGSGECPRVVRSQPGRVSLPLRVFERGQQLLSKGSGFLLCCLRTPDLNRHVQRIDTSNVRGVRAGANVTQDECPPSDISLVMSAHSVPLTLKSSHECPYVPSII